MDPHGSEQADQNPSLEMTVGEIEAEDPSNHDNHYADHNFNQNDIQGQIKKEHVLKPLFPVKNNTKTKEQPNESLIETMKQWKYKRLHKYIGNSNDGDMRCKTSYNPKRSQVRSASVNYNDKVCFKRTASVPGDNEQKAIPENQNEIKPPEYK